MSAGGRNIASIMSSIGQNQFSPSGMSDGLSNPIAEGLGRVSNVSTINGSQQNQQGFSQMLASLQVLRQMPNIDSGQFSEIMGQSTNLPIPNDIPEPDLSEFVTDGDDADTEEEGDS